MKQSRARHARLPGLVVESFDAKALGSVHLRVFRHVGVEIPSPSCRLERPVGVGFPSVLVSFLSTRRWDPFACLSFDTVALGPSTCVSLDTAALGTLHLHVVRHGGNGSLCLRVVRHGSIWVPVHPCRLTWKQGAHHVSKDSLAWVRLASYCPLVALASHLGVVSSSLLAVVVVGYRHCGGCSISTGLVLPSGLVPTGVQWSAAAAGKRGRRSRATQWLDFLTHLVGLPLHGSPLRIFLPCRRRYRRNRAHIPQERGGAADCVR